MYARSVLAFSVVSVLFLYAFLRLQNHLWLSLGFPAVDADGAWNTAVSFVTNTNWQWYSGESTMGHLVQMAGLAVQNFVSAAVGIAVAVAPVRGFARKQTNQLGNFWVDLVRVCLRILLPLSIAGAIVLVAAGAVQNLSAGHDVATLAGGVQHLTGGPVASQEVIKELGTNGGGFYNANSAHPFESPATWTNWFEIFLLLVVSVSLPRTFGRMIGSNRQGYAIIAAMAVLAVGSIVVINVLQGLHGGTVPQAVGAATEGTETRFGVLQSATFGSATTLTSTGAVDSFLVLSGRSDSRDKVNALDAGADDYVTKPFSIDELLARIRAVTRRRVPSGALPVVHLGRFTVDVTARVVSGGVHLTRTEWQLLEALLRSPGRLIGQRQLLQEVWGPTYLEQTQYLRQFVNQLRRKLEDDPSHPRHLLTEPGMGYRFQP